MIITEHYSNEVLEKYNENSVKLSYRYITENYLVIPSIEQILDVFPRHFKAEIYHHIINQEREISFNASSPRELEMLIESGELDYLMPTPGEILDYLYSEGYGFYEESYGEYHHIPLQEVW